MNLISQLIHLSLYFSHITTENLLHRKFSVTVPSEFGTVLQLINSAVFNYRHFLKHMRPRNVRTYGYTDPLELSV